MQSHLFADRQSKTVALRKVTDFEERFEKVVTLLLGDAFACVGYKELVAMLSALLPLLLRGARQVGKSTAVRHLGEKFEYGGSRLHHS